MLRDAMRDGYVIGSFNLDSLDLMARLVLRLAETDSPAIFQFGPWNFSYLPPEQIAAGASGLARQTSDCYVHLDHCPDLDVLERCVEAGFDSVMFDGSEMPLEKNLKLTHRAAEIAHGNNCAIEGCLGQLERGVDTDPAEAKRFAAHTEVDALAVAIGTGHGQERRADQIDLGQLKELSEIGIPLVIHGGSGMPEELMETVRASAAAKLNVATACYRSADRAVEGWLEENRPGGHASRVIPTISEGFWEVMHRRLQLTDSLGRARA
jgi:fructose-bisphosphate aldolase class II